MLVAHNMPFNSMRMNQNHAVHCSVEGQWQRRWDSCVLISVTRRQGSPGHRLQTFTWKGPLGPLTRTVISRHSLQFRHSLYQIICCIVDIPVLFLKLAKVQLLPCTYWGTYHACSVCLHMLVRSGNQDCQVLQHNAHIHIHSNVHMSLWRKPQLPNLTSSTYLWHISWTFP